MAICTAQGHSWTYSHRQWERHGWALARFLGFKSQEDPSTTGQAVNKDGGTLFRPLIDTTSFTKHIKDQHVREHLSSFSY